MLNSFLTAIVTAGLGAGPSTTPDALMLRYPAIGNVVFFDGSTEILPTTEWNGVKWTGYYNCALFAPRDGQLAINGNVADVDADGNPVYVPTNNVLIGQLNENNDNVPLAEPPLEYSTPAESEMPKKSLAETTADVKRGILSSFLEKVSD